MRADLYTLLVVLYCAACALFPADRAPRRRRPEKITNNELLCVMCAQMRVQCPSDRVFLRRAGRRLAHLFPYLPGQSRYNVRCRQLAPKLVVFWRAIRDELPGNTDELCLLDTTPLPRAQSVQTTRTSELAPYYGFGYSPAHSHRFWGMRLVLLCGPDGTVRDFDLVPADLPERQAAMALLERQPIAGQLVICDKGFAGNEFEQAVHQLGALVLRPSRADEPDRPQPPIGWIRQRIESIVNNLKDQLLLEHHGARTPDGLLARVAARILALRTSISLNWQLGLPPRTLTPYAD